MPRLRSDRSVAAALGRIHPLMKPFSGQIVRIFALIDRVYPLELATSHKFYRELTRDHFSTARRHEQSRVAASAL